MSTAATPTFAQASHPVLRWLTSAGPQVPSQVQNRLLSELFVGLEVIVLAILSALVISGLGVYLGGSIFLALIIIEITLD